MDDHLHPAAPASLLSLATLARAPCESWQMPHDDGEDEDADVDDD